MIKWLVGSLVGAAIVAATPVAGGAQAPNWPTRTVRVVVPLAAGGGTDIIARLIGQWLTERLGQAFIIENRPGGGTNIGTEAVVNAPADGYTLLLVDSTPAINATLYAKLNFSFIRDIAPVACLVRSPLMMEVNPSFPAKTVPEFIAYAKAHPGISMASAGVGNPTHLVGELFRAMTGIDVTHVPYRGGGPAVADLLAGQVQLYFAGIVNSIEYVKSGRLRALAVTGTSRSDVLPDVSTISEFVPGFEADIWYGVGMPRNTPAAIVEKLNAGINAGLADPRLKARLIEMGGTPCDGSPPDFGRLVAEDTAKWGKAVKFSGARVD